MKKFFLFLLFLFLVACRQADNPSLTPEAENGDAEVATQPPSPTIAPETGITILAGLYAEYRMCCTNKLVWNSNMCVEVY